MWWRGVPVGVPVSADGCGDVVYGAVQCGGTGDVVGDKVVPLQFVASIHDMYVVVALPSHHAPLPPSHLHHPTTGVDAAMFWVRRTQS